MANEDHLKILKQGGEAWNQWRDRHPGERPDLVDADLSEADLRGANLRSASLRRANLSGARLGHADLGEADLNGADLRGAKLIRTDLVRADLSRANFGNAILGRANMEHANLHRADLSGAHLYRAKLRGADLRRARGFVLDGNDFREARLSPNVRDPWSVIRRNYSGPRLAFHLLLLAVFAIPYVARTGMWLGINESQIAFGEASTVLSRTALELEKRGDPSAVAVASAARELAEVKPCLAEGCDPVPVWQVVLGVDKGWRTWGLAAALIAYNVFRGVLTWFVGPLREEEERTGYTPALGSYRWLFRLHLAVRGLFWLAVGSLIWNGYHWLFATAVLLPAS